MTRHVEAVDGNHWEVLVEWEARGWRQRAGRRLAEAHSGEAAPQGLRARQREERSRRRAENSDSGILDGCSSFVDGPDAIMVPLFVIAMVWFAGPLAVGIAFAAIELTLIALLALAAILGRLLLGRPWQVVAINAHGDVWTWHQQGWRAARSLADGIAAEIERGTAMPSIHPNLRDGSSPTQLDTKMGVGVTGQPWFRWGARAALTAIVVAGFVLTQLN